MHLENLIEETGGFGRYQIMVAIVTNVARVATVPSMLMMGFAGAEPDWWCASRNSTFHQSNFGNDSFKNCQWNGTCHREFSTDMVTVVSEWNLVCDLSWISNIIISVQMAGLLIGGILAGHCADSYGRKKCFCGGLFFICLLNVITVFSVSWIMFMVMRVLIGIVIGFVFTTFFLYQLEFVGKKWRIFMTSLPDWQFGMIVHGLLSQWLHHWKWLHVASAVLLATVLPSYFLLDESIRWLAVKGRLEEARHVVSKIAAMNRKPVPDTGILELIAKEERDEGDKLKSYTYLDLFKTRDLAKKTLLTCFTWCSSSIVYYGIYFGVKNLSGDIYLNMMLMALTELPVTPVTVLLEAWLKRRWCSAVSLFLTGAACFGVAVCVKFVPPGESGIYISALAMSAKMTLCVGWITFAALGVEQIPTVIRNRGVALFGVSSRIGGILAGQVLSSNGSEGLMGTFIAMGVLMMLGILSSLAQDETQGKPLQDTMKSVVLDHSTEMKLLDSHDKDIKWPLKK